MNDSVGGQSDDPSTGVVRLTALFLLRNVDNPIDLNAPEQAEVSNAVLHQLSQ